MNNYNSLEVQDSHAETGSVGVEDNVTLPQPSTPSRHLGRADGQSSSPLSEAPSLPPSPASIKVEGSGDELEAGRTESAIAASTLRSSNRRTGIDVCASAEFVDVLRALHREPDKQTTTGYPPRQSERVRNYLALQTSGARASPKISPPVTRRRLKNTKRHPVNLKKKDTGYKLESPDISDVGLLGSASERERQGGGQYLRGFGATKSGSTIAATEAEPAYDRAKSLPPGYISKPGAGNTGLARARRYSGDQDPGGLEPLREVLGVIKKDTMHANDHSEPRLRRRGPRKLATKSPRRKPGKGKPPPRTIEVGPEEHSTSSSIPNCSKDSEPTLSTDEHEVFEGFPEDEGPSPNPDSIVLNGGLSPKIPSADRSANHEFGGSPKISDENAIKKQKLNDGRALALPKTQALGESNELDVPDTRVHKDAFHLVDGVLSVPRGCNSCLTSRAFCNRAQPCSSCKRGNRKCVRKPGWVPARPKQQRSKQGDPNPSPQVRTPMLTKLRSATLPPHSESSSSGNLENLTPRGPPIAKRGRPRKSDVNGEIESEVKSEIKDTQKQKLLPWSSIDPQEGKPAGIRKPEVWCETRQELCESLPYYRSYQAGCYGHDGLVHGYLLDGFASPRDYISSKVIISHSGGKSGTDESGQRRLLTDQTIDDNTIKYLIKNMNQKWPLVLIMGNQCTNSPSKVPHRYCVMDWFKVTASWAEKDPLSQCIRWKFRFEKLDANVDGWWAATPSEEPNPPQEMVKASCLNCGKESPYIYEQGWACLNPNCKSFWMIGDAGMPTDLTYTENFLGCRTLWPEDFQQPPNSLAPPLDTELSAHVESGGVSRPFWKGMCCPKCGRLSCRELWEGWLCPTCEFSYKPRRVVFDAARLADPHRPVYTGPAIPSNLHNEEIASRRFVKDGLTVIQYQLGDCGTVTHILANKVSNSRPGDANWLLENYQNLDMPFRRFPMKCHHSQGRLLTQQFMYNCGAPYKFIVDVHSLPFNDSPPVVLKALDLIHRRVRLIHPEAQFNEVLNVGYFEKQKMDYHDDGEEGLGETVASISLGGSARMKFRVKSKYKDDRHCWTTEPEKHCQDAGSRNSIYIDENPEEEEEEGSGETEGLQPNGSSTRAKGRSNKAMLDLCLNHGDVMVMKGAAIQTHWEHTVVPTGLFRIAATARYITHNTPGRASKKQTTGGGETDGNDSTLPLTGAKSIKGEDSTTDVGDTQPTSVNGLGGPDQPEVIGEKPNFSQSPAGLHGPEFTTSSPTATVSQEASPISAISLPRRDHQELDIYPPPEVSHRSSSTQNMPLPMGPVPPLETTAPHIYPGHQINLVPHFHGVGPLDTPFPANQPGSSSGLPPQELLDSSNSNYFPIPQPQITFPYHPGPYEQTLTLGDRSSYMAHPPPHGRSSPGYPFGCDSSHEHYSRSEDYGGSEKTNNFQNTLNTTSQSANVHHNIFPGGVWGANESQSPLPGSETLMHQSNTSHHLQDYNNSGETKNPTVNFASPPHHL